MAASVLIVGGSGRMGHAVGRDLFRYTDARLTVSGRTHTELESAAAVYGARGDVLPIDLDTASIDELAHVVRDFDLVIQCVGPFRQRPPSLLLASLIARVNYVDVCDDRRATELRLAFHETAQAAGVTALIDTGTFPGIDNVLVADALARHPNAEEIHLSFVCAGSGGGGFGVLQTTFIAVSRPYEELREGRWVSVPSYRERRVVEFGPPLGRRAVYAFEVPEIWSLARTFPQLSSVTSGFGTIPEMWNWATAALARAPESLRTDVDWLNQSAAFMIPWVHGVDRLVGEALGIHIEVRGPGTHERIRFHAPSTTEAVGWATGAAAAMVLDGTIRESGVLLPETHIPPGVYLQALRQRGASLTIDTLL